MLFIKNFRIDLSCIPMISYPKKKKKSKEQHVLCFILSRLSWWTLELITMILTKSHSFAGCYWASVHFSSNCHLWGYSICHDGIRMDSYEVLMVSFLHVLHLIILYIIWDDDCGSYSQPPHWEHSFICLLCNMEPFLRIHCPPNGNY